MRPVEDRGIAAEALLPHPVAEDDHGVLARHGFVGAKRPADRGRHLQEIEHVPGDEPAGEPFRAGRADERRAGPVERADVREDGVLLPPVEEGRRGHGEAPELLQELVHAHELVGMRIGERTEEHAVDDAEDGAAGADAERQRQDGHDREARGPGELTDGVARVAHEVGKHWKSSWVVRREKRRFRWLADPGSGIGDRDQGSGIRDRGSGIRDQRTVRGR